MSFQADKSVSPASSPEPQLPKASKGLACTLCQTRKIRCDRQRPCAACTKARVECTYRARQAPRRRHNKATEVSLRARLGRLEELLKSAVARNEGTEADDSSPSANTATQASEDYDTVPVYLQKSLNLTDEPKAPPHPSPFLIPGKLVSGHGRSRYIENKLWTKIYEQLKDTQEILDEDSSDEESSTAFNDSALIDSAGADLTFGTVTSRSNLRALHPHPSHILALWTAFVENVNPLTKVIHVPSTQKVIYEASQNLDLTTRNVNALLFAIYLGAVGSMTEQENLNTFGESKSTLLGRYKYAAQKALLNANYLKASDLMVLQAFVLYLLAARPYYDARTFWAISGLAVRVAQRIGIHKDGSTYGMLPFEVEMRRRLWWQITLIDVRAAEVCGAGLTVIALGDTTRPLNINDADIHPDMLEPPVDREGNTEMCFIMLRSSIGRYFKFLYKPQLMLGEDPNQRADKDSGKTLQELMDEFESYLNEHFLRNADPLDPLQFFTSMVARAILCSWRVMDSIRKAADKTNSNEQHYRDTLFEESLKGMEYDNLGHTTKNVQRFLWHIDTHFQWHSLVALLGELRSRTSGELVDKAWQQIGEVFEHHPEMLNTRNPLHTAVGNLALAAWQARESAFARRQRGTPMPPMAPHYIVALRRQRLERERSVDKSNSNSPPMISTTASTGTLGSVPQALRTPLAFGDTSAASDFSGIDDFSVVSNPTPLFDSNQMDWSAWDSLLQNYEFPAPMEGTQFALPKDTAYDGSFQ